MSHFWTKFNPLSPSVTNCHIWLTPLSKICHKPLPSPRQYASYWLLHQNFHNHPYLFIYVCFYVFMHACQSVLRTVFSFHSLICLHRTIAVQFVKLVEFIHCVERVEVFCCWHHLNFAMLLSLYFYKLKNSTGVTSRNATLPRPCHTLSHPVWPPLPSGVTYFLNGPQWRKKAAAVHCISVAICRVTVKRATTSRHSVNKTRDSKIKHNSLKMFLKR